MKEKKVFLIFNHKIHLHHISKLKEFDYSLNNLYNYYYSIHKHKNTQVINLLL